MELEHEDYMNIFDEVKNMAYQYFNFNPNIQALYKSPVTIRFNVDDLEHECIASSTKVNDGSYSVKISAGMLDKLWSLANDLSKDTHFLNLINPLKDKRNSVRNYLFYLFVDLLLYHEWSHIFCGHLDFKAKNHVYLLKSNDDYDFNKVMELEADAKAATLILARLANNHTYTSKALFGSLTEGFNYKKSWEITVYSILALFDYWESSLETTTHKHPSPYLRAFASIIMLAEELADKPDIRNDLPFISNDKDLIYSYFARLVGLFYLKYKLLSQNDILISQMSAFEYCSKIGEVIKKSDLNNYRLIKARWT